MDLSRRGFLGGALATGGALSLAVTFGCGNKNATRIHHADTTGELTANMYVTVMPDGRIALTVNGRAVEAEVERPKQLRHEHFLACISSNADVARKIIRKTARLANYYHSDWSVLYIQTPNETVDRIPLDDCLDLIEAESGDVVELGEVLDQLAATAPRPAKVVEMRVFAGMTLEEVAAALATTTALVKSDWRFARAFLQQKLRNPHRPAGSD